MESKCDPRLRQGTDEFNRGLFFECHETLEAIWQEEHGGDRAFYQGIIQIAAGYYKWEGGVLPGAIKLMRSGLEKLEPYGPVHLGVDVGSFIHGVRDNLKDIEDAHRTGGAPPELRVPPLPLKIETGI